jgi:probable rRNA maturation factor
MAIEITNRTKSTVNSLLIKQAIKITLKFGHVQGDVSVVIINDLAMTKLNKQFRKINKPTDVLSFREQDSSFKDESFIGELFIDLNQIKRQAKKLNNTINWELAFITIHGALHLLGYEDETKKGQLKMEELGYKLINQVIK